MKALKIILALLALVSCGIVLPDASAWQAPEEAATPVRR